MDPATRAHALLEDVPPDDLSKAARIGHSCALRREDFRPILATWASKHSNQYTDVEIEHAMLSAYEQPCRAWGWELEARHAKPTGEALAPESRAEYHLAKFYLAQVAAGASLSCVLRTGPALAIVCDKVDLYVFHPDRHCFVRLDRDQEVSRIYGYNHFAVVGGKLTHKQAVEVFRAACQHQDYYAAGFFDGARQGLMFSNCFVGVDGDGPAFVLQDAEQLAVAPLARSLPLRTHVEQKARWSFDFPFEPKAKAPEFRAFLARSLCCAPDADEITAILEFVGACLFGAAASYRRALLLTGDGSNGKSTLIKAIVALFPADSTCSVSPQDMGTPNVAVRMKDKALNAVTEIPPNKIRNSVAFKSAISHEEIDGKLLYVDRFSFVPRCGHIFAGNEVPDVSDNQNGFWDRWLPIKVAARFPEGDPRRVEQSVQLARLAEERAGIVSEAVAAYDAARVRGRFTIPASSTEHVDKWRSDCDSVEVFLNDAEVVLRVADLENPDRLALLKVGAARKKYVAYCRERGLEEKKLGAFKDRLKALGIVEVKGSRGRYYNLKETMCFPRIENSAANDDGDDQNTQARREGRAS